MRLRHAGWSSTTSPRWRWRCRTWRRRKSARSAAARRAEHSALGLLGAGTGLGVSGLIPCGEGWIALRSEGGHVDFSPADERRSPSCSFAWREFDHVSAERLLSGAGLELIYRALADHTALPDRALGAPDIRAARWPATARCATRSSKSSAAMLGTVAGNLAVTLGAHGGIYIGGGIVPRLGERFDRLVVPRALRAKGALRQLPGAGADLRHHGRISGLPGRIRDPRRSGWAPRTHAS